LSKSSAGFLPRASVSIIRWIVRSG
jgi:hypothetical protein